MNKYSQTPSKGFDEKTSNFLFSVFFLIAEKNYNRFFFFFLYSFQTSCFHREGLVCFATPEYFFRYTENF